MNEKAQFMNTKNIIKNKIILIGGDHHNGLGLLRSLKKAGDVGVNIYGIIISENKQSYISLSKYWEKTWIIRSENDLLGILYNEFIGEEYKPIVIPYSDSVEEIIDQNLNKLSEKYILPSIDNKEGAVTTLMNKWEQVKLAQKFKIPIAESYLLELEKPDYSIIQKAEFPCIIKPVVSSEGNKLDISLCRNFNELKRCVKLFTIKEYKRVLVQEFIKKDFEILVFGCITPIKRKPMFCILKKIREWPLVGGTGSYYVSVSKDEYIVNTCRDIISMLIKINYSGMFDIELFYKKNKLYLNEINFRNSGSGILSVNEGVYYPYVWCLDSVGQNIDDFKLQADSESFYMNEVTDLRHVVYGNLSFKQWFADLRKVEQLLIFDRYDIKPSLYKYGYYLKRAVFHSKDEKKKLSK